jgi:hypothetical protein
VQEHGEVEIEWSAAGLDDLRQQTCACKDIILDMTALAWLFTLLPVSGKLPLQDRTCWCALNHL